MGAEWTIPRMWDGLTVAVLASGPSMSQEVADQVGEAHAAGTLKCIAVNDTYKLAPWADMLYACDREWWAHHKPVFAGRKVSLEAVPLPDVLRILDGGLTGFDPRPTHVRTGGNSGFQSIHIAAHLGAARILLCGFDMRRVGGKAHWFGSHPAWLKQDSCYADWRQWFGTLAPELKKRGVIVWNCTPDSALECFETMDFESALRAADLGAVHAVDDRHAEGCA